MLPADLAPLLATARPALDEGERIERLREAYDSNPNFSRDHAARVLTLLEDLHEALLGPLERAEKEAATTRRPSRQISPSQLRDQALQQLDFGDRV